MKLKSYPSHVNFLTALEHSDELEDYTNYLRALNSSISKLHSDVRGLESTLDRTKGYYIIPDATVQRIKQLYKEHYLYVKELDKEVYIPPEFEQ